MQVPINKKNRKIDFPEHWEVYWYPRTLPQPSIVCQDGAKICTPIFTGDIKRFSAKENFRKILKLGHFYLVFSSNKIHNEIKHSQRVSLVFFSPNGENSMGMSGFVMVFIT